jgi:hypothetical protein
MAWWTPPRQTRNLSNKEADPMPMFRKKPVVIEAQQVPAKAEDQEAWIPFGNIANWCNGRIVNGAVDGHCILIDTPEGSMKARQGDWIIREPFATEDRQFYPCKPDIFAETYEPVEGA